MKTAMLLSQRKKEEDMATMEEVAKRGCKKGSLKEQNEQRGGSIFRAS